MLRPYQHDEKVSIYRDWNAGARNVLSVLPTGSGKTVLFSDIIKTENIPTIAIAHRQELVCQISSALAREGIRHRVIAPNPVVKLAVSIHMEEYGKSYYDPSAGVSVAGVDTLIRRPEQLKHYLSTIRLWVMDEAHHVLKANKWGRAIAMLPNAKGLGVTATPLRTEGKGLGRHADGLFDTMIVGVNMRELIEDGYLSEYRAYAPPSDLDLSDVTISSSGEYSRGKLRTAVVRSHIVGDVVEHYLRLARGKLGVTFATDVETAGIISDRFNGAGVPSAVIHAKTPERDRVAVMRRFKRRDLLQIVNVDILGEGVDVPAIEVVSMARPTQSFGLFVQQFGRALRPLEGKRHALIIDHAGNILRHGLPDGAKLWSLDRRQRRKTVDNGAIPVKSCMNCASIYERIYLACPFCGWVNEPSARSTPEQVDGDLVELTPEALALLRGDVAKVDKDPAVYSEELRRKGAPHVGRISHVKRHVSRQSAQGILRDSIAMWAGVQRHNGRPDRESYKLFYFLFGVDVMSAQALNEKDATILTERVNKEISP